MNMPIIRIPARRAIVTLAAVLLACTVRAEDIDIFAGAPGAAGLPNVLIILDNSANWSASVSGDPCWYVDENGQEVAGDGPQATSPGKEQGTKMAIEKCALYNLIQMLPTNEDGSALYNVGLMLFNESPASISGGYPRIAIQPLDASTKTAFKSAIRNISIGADKGNNAAFAKSLYEAYLYLKNDRPYRGTSGNGSPPKWDPRAVLNGSAAGPYVTPSVNSCGRNYVIFIANGSPGENTDNEAKALLAALGGNTAPITYSNAYISNSDQANWADEFARFMSSSDVSTRDGAQSIIVHTLAVQGASSDGRWLNFIEAMARYGGGKYQEAVTAEELREALEDLFNDIQAANSVFASASMPISVNSRGTYLNHVFMGMFLPDSESRPRWDGNLKQYQFSYDQVTDTLRLADSRGAPAINSGTGFIAPGAVSYWSHSSSFWMNQPLGTPPSPSDSPDGEVIAKGAAAQQLRDALLTDQSGRKVYTCISCSAGSVLAAAASTQFIGTNTAITAAALGVSDSERQALIDWVRGTDNAGDERGPGGSVTVRPSVHGDVLHSRPAVVNYGGNIGIVAFYGANDGMLHAVVGNKENSSFGAGGETLWSFVPEEHYSKFKRLRDNDPIIKFPSTLSSTAQPRDYFVDGPVSVYQKFDSSGAVETVQLFVAMRRGGRVLYAFDVTDPTQPKFLWRKSSADIAVLGQTWSEPRVARIRSHARPVIVMGAGYDPGEDLAAPTTPTMGNAVLVLDTSNGAVVHTFSGVDRPVPADVTLVDADFDGYTDRAYALDLGGNVYRLDFERTDPDTGLTETGEDVWNITKLAASLGASDGGKFFYAPDVVLTRGFAIVQAGSGDREKPLRTDTQDYFYTLLDRNVAKGIGADFHTIAFDDLAPQGQYSATANQYGCYTALAVGEKVVNAATTIAGRTYFGTNQPDISANSCRANLGLAKSYAAPLVCKQPIGTELVGGGLPPSPVAGVVEVPYTDPQTGDVGVKHVPFIIGGNPLAVDDDGDGENDGDNNCNKAIEGCKVTPAISPRRSRIYWHTETER